MSIVDVFSKLIWLSPMLKKNAMFSVAVFKNVLKETGLKPLMMRGGKAMRLSDTLFYFQNCELSERILL